MNAANFSIRNSRYHLLDKNLGQLWPSLNTFCSKLFKSRINIGKLHESTKTSKTIRKKKPPWNILFFGSDAFSLETSKKLIDNMNTSPTPTVQSVEVVCKTTQCLVNNFSEENHLKLYSWPIAVMKNKYDLGVVVSFGCLIPGKIIRMFPHGILNVHASLLPRWRGAAPIIHTILNGDTVTGVSVMKIRPKQFDIGSILNTKSVPVPQACTSMQLQTLLATEAAELLLHTLSQIPFHEDQEKEQEQANVTYAHKPTKEMMYINWAEQTCDMIDRQYRAFHERVYLKTIWDCKVVKLLDMVDNETAKA
ncbi:methionyl-tRNA formyltransferase, mitochondrial isoform X2 [Octopus bimaculoides]|uniref:methionyl-tRNA formyltransferase, mitochondrial isoform X2 n=1 Tax=Octopus bimaculoides TaxID=37653 RepID=UPI0022E1B296|nr:methionyl-tRNA formyltransferase, mitochondrial isoform X2 [Octopus bimaculoides]